MTSDPLKPADPKARMIAWAKAHPIMATIAVLFVIGLIAAPFSGGDDEPDKAADESKPTASKQPSKEASEPIKKCSELPASEIAALSDGLRQKGDKVTRAYIEPIGEDVGLGIEYVVAAEVTSGTKKSVVTLGLGGEKMGDGLALSTKPALKFFTWGDMTTSGSPAAEARDAVEDSDAAKDATACIG